MTRKLKIIVTSVSITVLVVSVIAFDLVGGPVIVQQAFVHEQPENLEFSFAGCNGSSYPPEQVESSSWNNETLTLDVTITPNCGTTWLYGTYKLKNENELVLGYKTIAPYVYACNCDYKATYKITGLEEKEYKVTIKDYAFISRPPFLISLLIEDAKSYENEKEL